MYEARSKKPAFRAPAVLVKAQTASPALSIRDNRAETLALQKRRDAIHQGRPVQRLKIYPVQDGETNFQADPSLVDLNRASYEDLCEYESHREKQLTNISDGNAKEEMPRTGLWQNNFVFDAGDLETIRSFIARHEKGIGGKTAVSRVICNEGHIKKVSRSQAGDYGGIDSCMTITVSLENGTKIMAHTAFAYPVTLEDIRKAVDRAKSPVKEITAAGDMSFWNTSLKPYIVPFIDKNQKAFMDNLKGTIGGTRVSLKQHKGRLIFPSRIQELEQEKQNLGRMQYGSKIRLFHESRIRQEIDRLKNPGTMD